LLAVVDGGCVPAAHWRHASGALRGVTQDRSRVTLVLEPVAKPGSYALRQFAGNGSSRLRRLGSKSEGARRLRLLMQS
jgi:hypothetical protein